MAEAGRTDVRFTASSMAHALVIPVDQASSETRKAPEHWIWGLGVRLSPGAPISAELGHRRGHTTLVINISITLPSLESGNASASQFQVRSSVMACLNKIATGLRCSMTRWK